MAYNASQITLDAQAVTPSDSTDVSFFGFYVGITGDVAVTTAKGTVVTFTAVPAGQIIPVAVSKIMSTNTTATDIVGFGPT
jgi:hypothetical protein